MHLPTAPSVYVIEHKASRRMYIGSAVNFKKRADMHAYMLGRNRHHSSYLQRAWNKYGAEAFEFRQLAVVPVEQLIAYEQRLIDGYAPEFNMSPTAGSVRGVRWTAAQKEALRQTQLRRAPHIPPEAKAAHARKVRAVWAAGGYAAGMRAKSNTYLHEGVEYTLREAAKKFGINANTLKYRLAKGMDFASAVATPLVVGGRREKWEYGGKKMVLREVAEACGLPFYALAKRISDGVPFGEAVSRPLQVQNHKNRK